MGVVFFGKDFANKGLSWLQKSDRRWMQMARKHPSIRAEMHRARASRGFQRLAATTASSHPLMCSAIVVGNSFSFGSFPSVSLKAAFKRFQPFKKLLRGWEQSCGMFVFMLCAVWGGGLKLRTNSWLKWREWKPISAISCGSQATKWQQQGWIDLQISSGFSGVALKHKSHNTSCC